MRSSVLDTLCLSGPLDLPEGRGMGVKYPSLKCQGEVQSREKSRSGHQVMKREAVTGGWWARGRQNDCSQFLPPC